MCNTIEVIQFLYAHAVNCLTSFEFSYRLRRLLLFLIWVLFFLNDDVCTRKVTLVQKGVLSLCELDLVGATVNDILYFDFLEGRCQLNQLLLCH